LKHFYNPNRKKSDEENILINQINQYDKSTKTKILLKKKQTKKQFHLMRKKQKLKEKKIKFTK